MDEASEEELFEHFEVLYKEYENCAFSDITLPEQQKFFNRMRRTISRWQILPNEKIWKDQFQENRRKIERYNDESQKQNYGKTFEEIKEELASS